MKKVLVIAYHFPPGGGPGVQRVLKHVTYLRNAGWQPVVLTVENGDFPARDESLVKLIPTDITVVRVPILEPYSIYRSLVGAKGAAIDVNVNTGEKQGRNWKAQLAEWIRATFFIPDARVGWLLTAIRAGKRIIAEHQIDAIYSSSPPYTCALIARALHRSTGLPWVVGFRDPWTNFLTTPKRWWIPAAIDRWLEHSVFREATAVECAWMGIIDDAIAKYPGLDRSKFFHVPNGYDSSDFPVVSDPPPSTFTITYTGSLYGRRNPSTFFAALSLLRQRGVLDPSNIVLRFVGRFGAEVLAMMAASDFASSIHNVGYVAHRESIAWLLRSNVLLLIVDEAPESSAIVPGKVYEYLGTQRAVLALAPTGSAIEQLIQQTNAGRSVPQEDVEAIASAIQTLYERWTNGESLAEPYAGAIEQFERKNAAATLARIMDNLQL